MLEWVIGRVVRVVHWKNDLFTLYVKADIDPFIAGQFIYLGIKYSGKIIHRAYSHVSGSHVESDLEFYLANIIGGKLSSYFCSLKVNDCIFVSKKSFGSFILNKIPSCKYLWMISTGTAIGPYLSILSSNDKLLEKFEKIILIHAVRFLCDLNYLPRMYLLQRTTYKGKLLITTVVSRENNDVNSLTGRVPNLIIDGKLESIVGLKLDPTNSHVMLCGNPGMIKDTLFVLKEHRNMHKNSAGFVGNVTVENYWI